ncbi:MAG: T9SS type A sorting domain-containing protein [Candidatus Cloacimonetes bacterium]|nr:T9SS type A sorting domain-containing protein [Candidatus Cloacimonadota bacterium]MBL7086984.1 T9SS type A sorting domain-containing protein [Candidatus Cloacimonadota bacterium]
MRKVIKFKVLTVLLLIVFCSLLHSRETIIDTVYSELSLEACVYYNTYWNVYGGGVIIPTDYLHVIGDWEDAFVGGNCFNRSFFSFQMQETPEGYTLQSVNFYLYLWSINGNNESFTWPIWDIGGEQYRYPCFVDHVDYGTTFSYSDFNCPVLTPNIGEIDSSTTHLWREINVTNSYLEDVNNEKIYSQYRLKFPINTDYDCLSDFITFTSSYSLQEHHPYIILTYINDIGVKEECLNEKGKINIQLFPNPVNTEIHILMQTKKNQTCKLSLYNVKGQKIKTIFEGICHKRKLLNFDCQTISCGVYFLKFEFNDNKPIIKKILIK